MSRDPFILKINSAHRFEDHIYTNKMDFFSKKGFGAFWATVKPLI